MLRILKKMRRLGPSFAIIYTILVIALCEGDVDKLKKKAKGDFEEENYGVKYASKCEVCKVVTGEVEFQLNSKFKSPEVIETGYNYMQDRSKKKTKYEKSMIRLQEALESTCGALLEYNIHKERTDWTRFARGQSQTFKTLHGLKNKGVKVDLGIPHEMWDKPSAEITHLKSQCETFLENNEEDIEDWYQKAGQVPLEDYVCKKTLKKKEQGCLAIKALPEPVPEEKKPKKSKKEKETKSDFGKEKNVKKDTEDTEQLKGEKQDKREDEKNTISSDNSESMKEYVQAEKKEDSIIDESKPTSDDSEEVKLLNEKTEL